MGAKGAVTLDGEAVVRAAAGAAAPVDTIGAGDGSMPASSSGT